MLLAHLVGRLSGAEFEPVVLSLKELGTSGESIRSAGIRILSLHMRSRLQLTGLGRIRRAVRALAPALVHGWMYHGAMAGLVAAARRKVPLLWSIHHVPDELGSETLLIRSVIRLGARLSGRPDRILYVSQRSARQHEALGYAAEKSVVIANGVDCQRFRPDPEAYASVRRELGVAPGAFLIGLFARYHPTKDHGTFLSAAERLLHAGRSAEFVMAGDGVTRSNRALERQLAQRGLGDRVHLLGPRADMARLHASLDVLTCSSAFAESFPLVLAEAMACGVPCVTPDLGDAATIVGSTGRVIPPRDAHALAGAWMETIDLRPEHRAALGNQARARVVELFSIDETARRYEAIYREVLA